MHNGKLTIVGRLDNLFFSGGEGIQPEEVERVLLHTSCGFAGVYRPRCRQGVWSSTRRVMEGDHES